MENNFQTSFIPKKPIDTTGNFTHISKEEKHSNPLVMVSVLILIVTIVIVGGLYLYKGYLTKEKVKLSSTLDRVKESFDMNTINDLELFDKRVSASEEVLKNHIVLSPMFERIGALTLPVIQYTDFSHEITNDEFVVKMSGVSPDYKSVALQAEEFNTANGRLFKNVVFSNLNKDLFNNVTFDVTFIVDSTLLSYEKNILIEPKQ